MYLRLKSVSIIAARVDGRPYAVFLHGVAKLLVIYGFPSSFHRAEQCSLGVIFWWLGCFFRIEGVWGPLSPFVKGGSILSSELSLPLALPLFQCRMPVLFQTLHATPVRRMTFPVALNFTEPASPSTVVDT